MKKISFTIKSWDATDRPREKLILKGKRALSDAELIAILIGSGNRNESAVDLSKRILSHCKHNLSTLLKMSMRELTKFHGIGEAKAISILTGLELGSRLRLSKAVKQNKINSSKDVFELMQPLLGSLEHEEFWVLLLNNSNKIKHRFLLSKGGLTGTVVDVRLLFKEALEFLSTGVILCHNHPSGNLSPSIADKNITKKIIQAGTSLDIKVLDHLILTEKAYFSFADESLL